MMTNGIKSENAPQEAGASSADIWAENPRYTWRLEYQGFDPQEEGLREALCTLGNGYFATRGAAPEAQADEVHYPGTYLAGGYDRLESEVQGRVVENEDLVNLPNWLVLRVRIEDGDWFDLASVEVCSFRQTLDLRDGILVREILFRDPKGRETRLIQRRLVHMGQSHLAALETELAACNWSGSVEVVSALDGRVINDGVERYRGLDGRHLEPVETRRQWRRICTSSTCCRPVPCTPWTWTWAFPPGLARRGLPGPHLLGRTVHLSRFSTCGCRKSPGPC
jgi:trehalose/maltose hydrolase-like predicted phosphorylase